MCGRYQLLEDQDIDEINRIIAEVEANSAALSVTAKFGEIYPTNRVPILMQGNVFDKAGTNRVNIMHWGFPMGNKNIINARSETAGEKRMFTGPLRNNRCVVPSTGFFEWKHSGKTKEKYRFIQPGRRMLYMAGISAKYRVKNSDVPADCFIILTRGSNSYMADIHDRMPVIIYEEEINNWIADASFVPFALQRDTVALDREPAV